MAHSTLGTLDDFKRIESIIQSNNAIKKSTVNSVKEFLDVQENFLREVDQFYKCLDTVEHVADIFLDETKKTIIKEFNPLEQKSNSPSVVIIQWAKHHSYMNYSVAASFYPWVQVLYQRAS